MKNISGSDTNTDLDAIEAAIVHHPDHQKLEFIDSWDFVILLLLCSIIVGVLVGFGAFFVG